MALTLAKQQALQQAAEQARAQAYAPYSKFCVGAALWLGDGRIVTGINVENASYGLSMCAERVAVGRALAQGARPRSMQALCVVAEAAQMTMPCGACRQVLMELCPAAMPVLCVNLRDHTLRQTLLGALLPDAFGAAQLGVETL